MGSDPNPAIDMTHLATYTQGDRELEVELLTMFLPSAQGYIDDMATANIAGDGVAWWRGKCRRWPKWPKAIVRILRTPASMILLTCK